MLVLPVLVRLDPLALLPLLAVRSRRSNHLLAETFAALQVAGVVASR